MPTFLIQDEKLHKMPFISAMSQLGTDNIDQITLTHNCIMYFRDIPRESDEIHRTATQIIRQFIPFEPEIMGVCVLYYF